MRLALSEISTVKASFAEDVSAYAAAGFDGIGIWEFKLPPDDEANLALLREHGLAVANCVPAVPSILQLGIPGMEGPADPDERIESICASITDSSSSSVRPGLAVACTWNTEPSASDCCDALTFCAICFSYTSAR